MHILFFVIFPHCSNVGVDDRLDGNVRVILEFLALAFPVFVIVIFN